MMADNHLLNDNNNDGVGGGDDDVFVYTGGDQEVPRDVKRVRIAEDVDTILAWTFYECFQLIEVEGHNKLKKIEKWAFCRCRRLRRVTKMQGVIEIEDDAFIGCSALSELEFDKLEIIGEGAFMDCSSVRSINMSSIRRVGGEAFMRCRAFTGAVFGQHLERIGGYAFYTCTALTSIVIPLKDNLFLDEYAFENCENLSRVDTLAGEIHKTISSLHMETWRNEMEGEMNILNQTLPNTPLKTIALRQCIIRVLSRMEHYKTEHKILLKEAMTLLELALWKAKLLNEADDAAAAQEGVRVTRGQRKRARKDGCITSGASVVIKNVLPFLALE
jgi:hypothetical protein